MLTCANTQAIQYCHVVLCCMKAGQKHKSKYTGQRSKFSAFYSDSQFQLSNLPVAIIDIADLHVHALSIIQHICLHLSYCVCILYMYVIQKNTVIDCSLPTLKTNKL